MSIDSSNEVSPRGGPGSRFIDQLRGAPVTTVLFAICVVVFLAAEVVGSTRSGTTLVQFGASGRHWVWAGQYWRLATSMFLHIGALHLMGNLYFGFRLCAMAEQRLGARRFLALYLGSGLVGSAVSVIGHDALSAGASGALFGVVGWLLVTLRLQFGSMRAFTQNPAIRQQLIWIAAWFVLGAFIGLDNYAHGGGLLFGGLYAWALAAGAEARPSRRARLAVAFGVGALLIVASFHPLPLLHAPPELAALPAGD